MPKKNAERYLRPIEDVLLGIISLQSLPFEDLTKHEDFGALDAIESAQGGVLPSSRKAMAALRAASDLALSESEFAGRLDSAEVYRNLKRIIAERFIEQLVPLLEGAAHRAFAAAIKQAASRIHATTLYIACNITGQEPQSEVQVGPVVFMPAEMAIANTDSAFIEYLDAGLNDKHSDPVGSVSRRLRDVEAMRSHYLSMGWAAKVYLTDFDPKTARVQARKLSQCALDCVHLLVGGRWSRRMRLDGEYLDATRPAEFGVADNGRLLFTISHRSTTYPLPTDWWEQVKNNAGAHGLELLDIAIRCGTHPKHPTPLGLRFISALNWYGEAVREKLTPAQIVKFVTSIETVLTAGGDPDISETIAKRGAGLLWFVLGAEYEPMHDRFKAVYDLRSRVVHGEAAYISTSDANQSLVEAETLSRELLIGALQLFGKAGLEEPAVSNDKIRSNFDNVVAQALAAVQGSRG